MKVLIISECSKKALVRTRQIVDQFAPRIGRRTWSTEITVEGLKTLHGILKRNATKLTAVSCFWQKKNGENELLWIVGRRDVFNIDGYVPINSSECLDGVEISKYENEWIFSKVLSSCVAIASMFHDFGKCTVLFQERLRGNNKYKTEPFRHEYISALYFLCILEFSNANSDIEFFDYLQKDSNTYDNRTFISNIEKKLFEVSGLLESEFQTIHIIEKTHFNNSKFISKKFSYTMFILWLIVSHHKLAEPDEKSCIDLLKFISFNDVLSNLKNSFFSSFTRETEQNFCTESLEFWKNNFKLYNDLSLFQSEKWRFELKNYAQKIKERIQQAPYSFVDFIDDENKDSKRNELIDNNLIPSETLFFTLGRLALVLADHECSASDEKSNIQSNFDLYANSRNNMLHQKLDEHCVAVANKASKIVKQLTQIRRCLPCINVCRDLRKNTSNSYYQWQNKAFNICNKYKDKIEEQGFFGVNLASTGRGKTLANMRIMYALSEGRGFRTSILLGLRTLTNQTGDALKQKLGIDESDIAVITGENVVSKHQDKWEQKSLGVDESEEILNDFNEKIIDGLDKHLYVTYSGSILNTFLTKYLERTNNSKVNQIINAPILISTIDMLINGLESRKAAHMLPSIVRLLSSDIVIDEVDDYNLSDLPAVSRLVYYAGMFGSNVLLSSATIPRILVKYLFDAYTKGRALYNKAMRKDDKSNYVMTGFFDEFSSNVEPVYFGNNIEQCENTNLKAIDTGNLKFYDDFYQNRITNINSYSEKIHRGRILEVNENNGEPLSEYADYVYGAIDELHRINKIEDEITHKNYSVGIVRFAHINEMINVFNEFKDLVENKLKDKNTIIKTVIYHSRYTTLVRSEIERRLDEMLCRKKSDSYNQYIQDAINSTSNSVRDVIVVVFASPVAEVGRDHDYDWAVIEPSSMRAIIQLVGRVQRHRRSNIGNKQNFIVLSKNYKRFYDGTDDKQYFVKPGYEIIGISSKSNKSLEKHDLIELKLNESPDFEYLSSNSRLRSIKDKDLTSNFLKIEIKAIDSIFSLQKKDNQKYKYQDLNLENILMSLFWCGFLSTTHITQKLSQFRKNNGNEWVIVRKCKEETEELSFFDIDEKEQKDYFIEEDLSDGKYLHFLFKLDEKSIIEEYGSGKNFVILKNSSDKYVYNVNCGFYRKI